MAIRHWPDPVGQRTGNPLAQVPVAELRATGGSTPLATWAEPDKTRSEYHGGQLQDMLQAGHQVPTGTRKTAAAELSRLWQRKKRPSETPQKVVDQAMTVVERMRGKLLAPEDSH